MNKTGFCMGMLLAVTTPTLAYGLDVGGTAPLFQADSTEGEINLAHYRGRKNVVLALYFAVFTPV
ncbi:MAG: alkyl hydroperoxide reductase [Thermodesulfobacteriota bacterium]|nr:alkyl hydroperoxide reductase [Thermodesulfobacteriota bacterium]